MKLMGGAMKLMGGGFYPASDLRGPTETYHNTAQHGMAHLQVVK